MVTKSEAALGTQSISPSEIRMSVLLSFIAEFNLPFFCMGYGQIGTVARICAVNLSECSVTIDQ